VFSSKDSYLSDKFLFSNSALNINIGKKWCWYAFMYF
jgi:hypothetical protein